MMKLGQIRNYSKFEFIKQVLHTNLNFLLMLFMAAIYSRRTMDFCVLVLYSAILLNLFIRSGILVDSLGFSVHRIITSAREIVFISPFSIWMPLSLFLI